MEECDNWIKEVSVDESRQEEQEEQIVEWKEEEFADGRQVEEQEQRGASVRRK